MPRRRKEPSAPDGRSLSAAELAVEDIWSSGAPEPSGGAAGAQRRALAPGLHVVATPIGNAADITLRALDALKAADAILCEDTRVTAKLLAIHGIARPLITYHDHNADRVRPEILARLGAGRTLALVSDAGTPLVSDPGYKLVREALARNIAVHALPGPSSVLAALVLAGLPTDRFYFAGFLPEKQVARRKAIEALRAIDATIVLLEATRRLPEVTADLAALLGARPAAVAREITKMFEETRRGTLAELALHYAETGAPKGEAVIVIGPPERETRQASADEIDAALSARFGSGSLTDAVDAVADATGWRRRDVYARALALKDRK
jgi:16S rRNA (cytidine1402-2'-O)-methyltransferase